MLARLRAAFRASPENPSTSLANPSAWLVDWMTGGRSSTGKAVTSETALGATAVYRAVSILAETIGSMPLHVYERQADGSRRMLMDHPVQQVLDEPNPWQTRMGWLECMVAAQCLHGNSYDYLAFDRRGRLRELVPLLPGVTHPERNGRRVRYVTHLPDGRQVAFNADEVAHVPWLTTDGVEGKSPIRLHRESIGLALAAEEFGARFFGSGSKPSGVLQHPGNVSADTRDLIREQWTQAQGGLANAHKVAILPNGMTWQSIGVPPEDAQFLETRMFQVVEVARIYGVPPHLLGALERATFSNVEEQDINFVRHCIRPRCVRIEQVLNRRLFHDGERGRLFVEFSLEALLRGDSAARSQFYRELWGVGGISSNEIRAKENLPPVEGGDEFYVPLNMVPMSRAADLLDPDSAPASAGSDEPPDDDAQRAWPAGGRNRRVLRAGQQRSVAERQRIQGATQRLFREAARRVVDREAARVRRAAASHLPGKDIASFTRFVRDFYDAHRDYIQRQFAPVFAAYGEQMDAAARAEVGGDPEPELLAQFSADYTAAFAARTAASARNQLLALVDELEADALAEGVEQRVAEWEERRPEKTARRESIEAGAAFAKFAYASVGVMVLRWVTVNENCPLCQAMNGRTVGIRQFFLDAGETVNPGGEVAPLTTRRKVGHPPLHDGCDCLIVAEV